MFIDKYPPETILRYGWISTPRFSTSITAVSSGDERRNQNWSHPLLTLTAPQGIECYEDLNDLYEMFLVTAGPFHTFPIRDPNDFASRRLLSAGHAPPLTRTDQVIGEGDGIRTVFQLIKTYTFGGRSYVRTIHHPVVSSVLVGINGMDPAAVPSNQGGPYQWAVDRQTGEIVFDKPIRDGQIVTAGYLFDIEVRFESDDSFDAIVTSWKVSGHSALTFIEVRPC